MPISEEAEMPEQRESSESASFEGSEDAGVARTERDSSTGAMRSRLRVRVGETEVEFEGSEAFLEREMPNLLNILVLLERGQETPVFSRPAASAPSMPLSAVPAAVPMAVPLVGEPMGGVSDPHSNEPPVVRFAKELGVDLAYL